MQSCYLKPTMVHSRWAPISYKRSYNPLQAGWNITPVTPCMFGHLRNSIYNNRRKGPHLAWNLVPLGPPDALNQCKTPNDSWGCCCQRSPRIETSLKHRGQFLDIHRNPPWRQGRKSPKNHGKTPYPSTTTNASTPKQETTGKTDMFYTFST